MNEEKKQIYSLYKKSLNLDATLMFLFTPLLFLILYFFIQWILPYQDSTIVAYITGGVTASLYILYPFYNRYIFGDRSIAMKRYNLRIINCHSTWYRKIYFNVLHVILISKYNPWFGHDFNEICRNASSITGVDVVRKD